MGDIGKAIHEMITTMSGSVCEEHVCPICNKVVPQKKVSVMGMDRLVQPRCKCEVDQYEQELERAERLKREREIERKFSISSLGERFTASTFEAYQILPGAERAYERAKHYAEHFPEYEQDALLIWGVPGNGKSHLAAAVCHSLKAQGYIPVFQSVPELLERIRSTFGSHKPETEQDIMRALLDCDLLVLDDIGAEKPTDWVSDVLYRVVDGRYRQKRPIFYTSNLKPSELEEKLGKRIYDRIMETTLLIENKATSFRIQVATRRILTEKEKQERQWCE